MKDFFNSLLNRWRGRREPFDHSIVSGFLDVSSR